MHGPPCKSASSLCYSELSLMRPGCRFGFQVLSAFDHAFQTHLFAILPASFPAGFKALVGRTLEPYTAPDADMEAKPRGDVRLWGAFERLGLLDRYEALVSSVCYERIEAHILGTCTGMWEEAVLGTLREWMSERVVPWMLLPYARGARNCAFSHFFSLHSCRG